MGLSDQDRANIGLPIAIPPKVDAVIDYLNTGIRVERDGNVIFIYRGQLRVMTLTEVEASQIEGALRLTRNAK